ncbi:hypothetical protein EBQ26_06225 [Allofranklinella schreckenbergeri]|uniref:PIN domain-containing protein n=1 Tax=Allofranklinella schreckenbergeri TaxID=1076744 RepID=A0A3M6Q7C8_9BURK|nr:hypothetical protein [Allofranklinella schreckenbergeri]RMW98896.1 hypothetical protein EBQ26_06225 [Allofranklinella schreckenbergeri]
MNVVLIDTGALVALYAPESYAHRHYTGLLADAGSDWRLCSTWPCVVEACHFLRPDRRWRMLRWVAEGGVAVFPMDAAQLPQLLLAMQRYTELPRTDMDFADASLVDLAAQTGVNRIMPLDVRDFSRYRLPDGRAFEIL